MSVTAAIQALHAAISRKPHSAAVRDAVLVPLTHQHRKGGLYRFIGYAKVQTDVPLNDYDAVVVYQATDGTLWVRPNSEFHDGRFKALPE